ncbi:MAG: Mu-like prophage major head subunit gpT family protein [Planctomycetota bacterium]
MPASDLYYSELTDPAIVGSFYSALEDAMDTSWVGRLMWLNTDSVQESETYKMLGQAAPLRKWKGKRQANQLNKYSITIDNDLYESTMEFDKRELRQDKTGQIQIRIGDQAMRAVQHWERLLSDLINGNGDAYDGESFFDTDHGESGTAQKNALTTTDIAALNVGTATTPTADEMASILVEAVAYFHSLTDDQGEPANGGASSFTVMCGARPIYSAALQATGLDFISTGASNPVRSLTGQNITLRPVYNTRLTGASSLFYLFRDDGMTKPFIGQEESGVQVEVLGEGSDYAFDNHAHKFGINANRGVGYGEWKHAIKLTMD